MTATQETGVAVRHEFSVAEVIAQAIRIQEVMKGAMTEGEHFGVIPGTGTKKVLLKAGAEKLLLMFRMAANYDVVSKNEDPAGHASYMIRCSLTHIPTGMALGSGMGSGTTREPKWGMVDQKAACPKCGKATVFKSKNPGEGWYCWKKKEGCGATFAESDTAISSQKTGKSWRENLPEQHNTVLKMACKRALIAAVLNATAASDCFTQDVEDLHQAAEQYRDEPEEVKQAEVAKPAQKAAPKAAEPAGKVDIYITQEQRTRLFAMLKTYSKTEEQFRAHLSTRWGLGSSKDILKKDYDAISDWIIGERHGVTEPQGLSPALHPEQREPGEDEAGIGKIDF